MFKSILVCSLFLLISYSLVSQYSLPNGDMEEWIMYPFATGYYEEPGGGIWTTANRAVLLNPSIFKITTFKTEDAYQGNYAAKIVTNIAELPGDDILQTGTLAIGYFDELALPPNNLKDGMPFTGRPDRFKAWYKYLSVNGDSCTLYAILSKWNNILHKRDTIGYAGLTDNVTVPEYTLLDLPITYFSVEEPDTLSIIFASSAAGDLFLGQVGSTLYIDDISLEFYMPPDILSQPQSWLVCPGDRVSFEITASGTLPIIYQWQKDEINIPDATNPSYIIEHVIPENQGSYRCIISNIVGMDTSDVADLTVQTEVATVYAGSDATICQGYAYQIMDATASNYISLVWQHNGTGSLSGATSLSPIYTPGQNETGEVNLVLIARCGSVSDQMKLMINPSPTAYAGNNATICEGGSYTLHGFATNYSSIVWKTNGTGLFNDTNSLTAIYYPSTEDFNLGSVILILDVYGIETCPIVSDNMVLHLEEKEIIYGPTSVELWQTATYSVIAEVGYEYYFTVERGNITNQTYNSIDVQWIETGIGYVHLKKLNPNNYVCNSDLQVNITSFGIANGSWSNISVYPNPADDQIIITGLNGHTIYLYNYRGEIQYKGSVSPVDIHHLPEGIYFLKIEDGDGRIVKVDKIIKL